MIYRRFQLTVGDTVSRDVNLCCTRNPSKPKPQSKPLSSIPPWSLYQLLSLYQVPALTGFLPYFSQNSIAVKRHHDQGYSYKGQHLIGDSLHVRVSVHYGQGWTHGSIQAVMAPQKQRVLYLVLKANKSVLQTA